LHVGPGVLVVGVPAARVYGVPSGLVDARNEWDPGCLLCRGEPEDLVPHGALQVTVLPGHALHSCRAGDVGLLFCWHKVARHLHLLLILLNLLVVVLLLLLFWFVVVLLLLLNRLIVVLLLNWLIVVLLLLLFWFVVVLLLLLNRLIVVLLLNWLIVVLLLLLFWFVVVLLLLLNRLIVALLLLLLDLLLSLCWLRIRRRSRASGPCSLADIGTAIKAAESIPYAVHVRLASRPAVGGAPPAGGQGGRGHSRAGALRWLLLLLGLGA